ncbi:ATP-binding protein [Acetobacter sacchari]|uniref:ATP-binding protein n=1 Tax=Acetobacter sacchari TaxID=2661687 RepID=UPI0038CFE1A8
MPAARGLAATGCSPIPSPLPVSAWHAAIGQTTYADAILDRVVHNAHRIELAGESLRRTRRSAKA